jgi:Zn-dependent protease
MPWFPEVGTAILLIVAVTFHEVAHGMVAYLCGDKTAKQMGRLTFNPFRHVDPVGTILLPFSLLFLKSPFIFGYAKPVPINPNLFKHYRSNMIFVAFAGPLMNLILAFMGLAFLTFLDLSSDIQQVMNTFVQFNLVLAVFNMFPLLPLDGGRILGALLPRTLAMYWARLEPAGLAIVLILIALPSFSDVLGIHLDVLGPFIQNGVNWARQTMEQLL